MKKILLFVLLALGVLTAPANAQQASSAFIVTTCGTLPAGVVYAAGQFGIVTMDTTGKICDGGSGGGGSPYQFVSAGAGQYALAITSVQTLTVPAGSLVAEICVETAPARYTTTATTPSSTVGVPVATGGCFQLAGAANLNAFKIIGSGAVLDVEYFK